jgi:hypothetical protein
VTQTVTEVYNRNILQYIFPTRKKSDFLAKNAKRCLSIGSPQKQGKIEALIFAKRLKNKIKGRKSNTYLFGARVNIS